MTNTFENNNLDLSSPPEITQEPHLWYHNSPVEDRGLKYNNIKSQDLVRWNSYTRMYFTKFKMANIVFIYNFNLVYET